MGMGERSMTARRIVRASRVGCRTFITLECGHIRSLGGHVWSNGKPVGDTADLVRFGVTYDCHDGRCHDKSNGGACAD